MSRHRRAVPRCCSAIDQSDSRAVTVWTGTSDWSGVCSTSGRLPWAPSGLAGAPSSTIPVSARPGDRVVAPARSCDRARLCTDGHPFGRGTAYHRRRPSVHDRHRLECLRAWTGTLPNEPTANAVPTSRAAAHWTDRLAGRRTVERPERHATTSSTTHSVSHAQAIHARSTATCPSHAATCRTSPGWRWCSACQSRPMSRWNEGDPDRVREPQRHAHDQQEEHCRWRADRATCADLGCSWWMAQVHEAPRVTPLTSTADATADTRIRSTPMMPRTSVGT